MGALNNPQGIFTARIFPFSEVLQLVGRESEAHPALRNWVKPIMPQHVRTFVPCGTFFFTVTLVDNTKRRDALRFPALRN